MALVLGLGLLTSGCSAVDTALLDDGDAALVADASVRAEVPTTDRVETGRRSVRFAAVTETGGSPLLASTDGGLCGWIGDAWAASLGGGGQIELSGDAQGRTWSVLSVTTGTEPGGWERADDGTQGRDGVLRAVWARYPSDGGEVRLDGRVTVDASGLSARFVPDEPSGGQDPAGETLLPGTQLAVSCGVARADAD